MGLKGSVMNSAASTVISMAWATVALTGAPTAELFLALIVAFGGLGFLIHHNVPQMLEFSASRAFAMVFSCNHYRQGAGRQSYHHTMDTRLLELLVCPVTKGPLEYDRERQELTSRSARLAYPVRDDIPILLESEARVMTDEELGL